MSKRLFVGNLSTAVTEEQLVRFFSGSGEVVSVSIPLDRRVGTPRGFAFVELATAEQAQQAMAALDDTPLGGRRVRLRVAHEDRRRQDGGYPRGLPRRVEPATRDDAWGEPPQWDGDGPDRMEDSGGRRDRGRKGGKHGSDRVRARGTRRFIE